MKIEFESMEEARAVLHALKRTNARNSYGDLTNILGHCENFENRLFKLIDKPVETTNEQPKIPEEIKIQLMEIMSKHVELRNSDSITNMNLYHSFLDWEKEVWKLL